MSCGVGRRGGSDLALLWLWCRPAAIAPIQPLAWELPYATDVALKRQKKKKKKKRQRENIESDDFWLMVMWLICVIKFLWTFLQFPNFVQ